MVSVTRTLAAVAMYCISATLAPPAFAQSAEQAVDRETAIAIKGLESERENILVQIRKCEKTIANSNAIIEAAKAKGNTSASEIATKAAITAEEARRRYEHTLRVIESTLAGLKRANEPLPEKEKRRARERLAELRVEISRLQGMLRRCIDETTKSFAERESLEREIDFWYDAAVKTAREDLLFECGTLGLQQVLAARKTTALDKITDLEQKLQIGPHPLVASQYRETIAATRKEIALVDYNDKLIEGLGNLKTAHDVYAWDQTASPATGDFLAAADLLAGIVFKSYGIAKIDTIAVLGVASELGAWYRLRGIDKKNAACSDQVKPIAARMESSVKEINCLEGCLENTPAGCVDRCRGKLSPSAPPPPAN